MKPPQAPEKTNPIQTQSKPVLSAVEWANLQTAKMNVNLTLTKDYRKNYDFAVRKNKPNFQNAKNERKLTYNKGLQKKRLFRSPKNKPNLSRRSLWRSRIQTQFSHFALGINGFLC